VPTTIGAYGSRSFLPAVRLHPPFNRSMILAPAHYSGIEQAGHGSAEQAFGHCGIAQRRGHEVNES
jgi:hypothetical protein